MKKCHEKAKKSFVISEDTRQPSLKRSRSTFCVVEKLLSKVHWLLTGSRVLDLLAHNLLNKTNQDLSAHFDVSLLLSTGRCPASNTPISSALS